MRLIRECADLICMSISKIFNCSLTTGAFPGDWKSAKVTLIFKQGSSSDMNNYRPISVSSGIQENAFKWFRSCLENQTQICSVSRSLSKTCSLQSGIPQGTILGPLLFLLHINDLPNCLTNSYPRMYADDMHITYSDKDVNIIQSCLN